MRNFITNSRVETLKKRLIELIDKSDNLKFLVGFFYFSGIRELYESLKNNSKVEIKVLVGLNVDRNNFGLIEFGDSEKEMSDDERTYKFIQSVRKSLNTENFDNPDFYEQVKFFIDLIRNNRLQIRKTSKPNHAKLYIFKLQEGQVGRSNLFITGSSNLTNSGLSTQEEFNVEISDYGFDDAEEYFDSLWSDAIRITEDSIAKKKLIEVIEQETLVKRISPFEAYVVALHAYLSSFKQKDISDSLIPIFRSNGYTPYQYQLDAVRQALSIIEGNNGVIVADVVGLGKTIIACAIAQQLKKRGVVICPPGLIGDRNKTSGWNKYAEEFRLTDWEVRSSGDLESISEFVQKTSDIEVVIVDEAHRFRNQDTKDYEHLKNICRGKIVILLTATPFNNRPGDILSLLKLFITPKKSTITLENNLVDKFKAFKGVFDRLGYIKKYWNSPSENKRKKAQSLYESLFEEKFIDLQKIKARSQYLAKQIRDVIEPVTIRRNRLDLMNSPYYKKEVVDLSRVEDPKEWFFGLSRQQSDFYDRIIGSYFGDPDEGGLFKGAIYRPFEYEVDRRKLIDETLSENENFQFQQQRNLFDFMRRLMVKRFESSFGSFRQSIMNFKTITEMAKEFIDKTDIYILDRDLMENIYDKDLEGIELGLVEYAERIKSGEYPKNHRIYTLSKFKYKDEFLADIDLDLKLFKDILKELDSLNLVKNDPKTACLIQNLEIELERKPEKGEPKRKIVIFSEYLDTVKYLQPILQKTFGHRVLTVTGDLSTTKVSVLVKNFDASSKEQVDDFDILLSSDKISEGFNLNRAGMVINYDIPWNPVRVIQRVGRINRISKKVFADLFIVNFFPTERGSELVKSRETAANKMFLIHNTLGEDSKIFDIDEEPTAAGLYKRVQQNPDDIEEESFRTKAQNEFERLKREHPILINSLNKFPPRIKVAKGYENDQLLVFLKKGRLYSHIVTYSSDGKEQIVPTTFEDVFDLIVCDESEKELPFSNRAWASYQKVKEFKAFRSIPHSEQSIETKALNNLNYFISKNNDPEIIPYKDFLRVLKEDIIDFGTLTDFTLRRIANLESNTDVKLKKAVNEIESIQKSLGGMEYLLKEKGRQRDLAKEVIIAIENRAT